MDDAIFIDKGLPHQKLGCIVSCLKDARKYLVQLITHLEQQKAEQLVVIMLLLPRKDLLCLRFGILQTSIKRRRYQIRILFSRFYRGKQTDIQRCILIHFHVTYGNQAVKPIVCRGFDKVPISRLVVAFFPCLSYFLRQLLSLVDRLSLDGHRMICPDVKVLHFIC